MRLFILSDTHGDDETFEKALEFSKEKADLLLLAGDYILAQHAPGDREKCVSETGRVNRTALKQRMLDYSAEKYGEVERLISECGIPTLMVPGNHERINYFDFFEEQDLHAKSVKLGEKVKDAGSLDDIVIAGYGGAGEKGNVIFIDLHDIGVSYSERELYNTLSIAEPDIVLLHNPPKKTTDSSGGGQGRPPAFLGSMQARRYIVENTDDRKPRLVVAGHRHSPEIQRYRNTTIVNPGNLGRYGKMDSETGEMIQQSGSYGTFAEVELDSDGDVKQVIFYSAADNIEEIQSFSLKE